MRYFPVINRGMACVLTILLLVSQGLHAGFSTGGSAVKFGVHQISLTGNGAVANPFDVLATVSFTAPSGSRKTVNMFYDGSNTWKARVYVTETGNWSWSSSCVTDGSLNGKSGSFSATASTVLKGMLKKHSSNPKALMTDNGKGFFNMADTAYYLFTSDSDPWQAFIRDDWNYGITLLRANVVGALRSWPRFFEGGTNTDKFNLANFQRDDARMQWMLENYPGMYVELIMFPESNTGWQMDETFWKNLTAAKKSRLLRFMLARYAAYPQIIWEIGNDYNYTKANNKAMANEIGAYVKANDPWGHLITTGGLRDQAFAFASAPWCSLAHIETLDAYSGDQAASYGAKHVFNGEDRYESHKAPKTPAYYFSRMAWAWLLSGGSSCYGGFWDVTRNYTSTTLTGLNGVRFIRPYLANRNIDLTQFSPNDGLATDLNGAGGKDRVKLAHRSNLEYIAMITGGEGSGAYIKPRPGITPGCSINLAGVSGTFNVEWLNCTTGAIAAGGTVNGGARVNLRSPWVYTHVVVRLSKGGTPPVEPTPDTQKPTIPSGLNATVQSSSAIQLNWTASTDNVGVVAYDVYRGAAKVGSTATTTFTNSGLTPSTAYAFKVQARDQAGNLSDFSAAVTATTSSGPVEPPPVSGGTVYQAEAAVVFGCVKYTSYVDYINNSGDYIEWTVNVPTAGNYALGFKYAFGSGNRPLEIKANGTVVAASLAFPGTGSTTNYQTVTTQASLSAGVNKIRTTAIGYSGGNMDALTVTQL